MKNKTILKEHKWLWPVEDEIGWNHQHNHDKLCDHVLPYVKNNSIMVQAGGNCGFILNTFVDHFDHVYTFEPDPISFYCLVNNVEASNVTKMQACLGLDRQTVKTQQLTRVGRLHDVGGVHVAGEGFVPTIAIDDLNLPDCGLMQLDIEGYELNALQGAIRTIMQFKPVLCIEFCESWLNRYAASAVMINKLLDDLEYQQVDEYGADKIFTHKSH